jgi:TolA-binding protein
LIFHIVMQLGHKVRDRRREPGGRRTNSLGQVFLFCVLCSVFCMLATGQVCAADAVVLFQTGKFDEARVAFEAVIKEAPDDPIALYYLGRLTSEGAKSKAYFLQLKNKHPEHDLADDALFELAEVDFAQGLYLTARGTYRALLSHYPKTNQAGMAHYRIGLTFLAIKQADSALVAFDVAQMTIGGSAKSHARLGRLEALLQKKQKAEALGEAKQWLVDGAGDLEMDVQDFIVRVSPDYATAVEKKTTDRFWIQVAALGNEDGALALKGRLENKGFRVDLETKPNSTLMFVFVGAYPTRAAAEQENQRIMDQFKDVNGSKVIER